MKPTGAAWRWPVSLAMFVVAGTAVWAAHQRQPVDEREIFRGVFYGCRHLEPDDQGSGLMHWVRIDLTEPGIDLFTTPVDAVAVAEGRMYRVRYTERVLQVNDLAVCVNATRFGASGYPFVVPGSGAAPGETLVSNHVVNHVHPHSYLLWFDGTLRPTMETKKPPQPDALARARWGVSTQGVIALDGQVRGGKSVDPEQHTTVGIDADRRLLWIVVFEHITERRSARELVALGAKDVCNLDGGDASQMAISRHARGIRGGTLHTGFIPVATHFGVRAEPLP